LIDLKTPDDIADGFFASPLATPSWTGVLNRTQLMRDRERALAQREQLHSAVERETSRHPNRSAISDRIAN
jgi:hypothetical protein